MIDDSRMIPFTAAMFSHNEGLVGRALGKLEDTAVDVAHGAEIAEDHLIGCDTHDGTISFEAF